MEELKCLLNTLKSKTIAREMDYYICLLNFGIEQHCRIIEEEHISLYDIICSLVRSWLYALK